MLPIMIELCNHHRTDSLSIIEEFKLLVAFFVKNTMQIFPSYLIYEEIFASPSLL